jgi:hypothetical protein
VNTLHKRDDDDDDDNNNNNNIVINMMCSKNVEVTYSCIAHYNFMQVEKPC